MAAKNREIYNDKSFRVVESHEDNSFGDCTDVIKYRVYFNDYSLGTAYNFNTRKIDNYKTLIQEGFIELKNSSKLKLTNW